MKYRSSQGGCLCGNTRYELVSEPMTLYACHCTDCQTATGASCVLGMRIPNDGIKVVLGDPKPYERARADGRKKSIFRCSSCLTALWGTHSLSRGYITLYAGTLDNSSSLRPVGHIWTDSAQSWVTIPSDTLNYAKQPQDLKLFEDVWRDSNA